MADTEIPETGSILQSVKGRVNVDAVVDHIRQSKDIIIEIGIYAGIGFFTGYLIKRYNALLAILIFFIGGLVVLSKLEIVTVIINWDYMYQQMGMQPYLLTSDSMIAIGWEWVRTNALLVSSGIIGFLFGLRVG